jgi:transketolase
LYNKVAKIFPDDSQNSERDIVILSKGHASLGLYAILADRGFFPIEKLREFGKYNSFLGGHPDYKKIPGVEASTGSLGHGLPMAVGFAVGFKIKKLPNRVYAIIGDGEANEGTIWESALLAAHHQLTNLTVVVDFNHSTDRALDLGNIKEKFVAFGWEVLEVEGHNQEILTKALQTIHTNKPVAIIAKTIKGYGCKMIENDPAWHHKCPNAEEYQRLLADLY